MKQPSTFLIALCITFAMLVSGCGKEDSQEILIDVAPLYNLELPQDFIFDEGWVGEWDTTQEGFHSISTRSMLDVYFWQHPDVQAAADLLVPTCLFGLTGSSTYLLGGEGENRYCISSVQEEIVCDLPFLCRPTGNYFSNVVFQKGKILIEIKEVGWDVNNKAREDAIRLLAEKICEKIKRP